MYQKIRCITLFVAVCVYAGVLSGDNLQISSAQQRPVHTTQLICCNLMINVPGTWIGASRECENYMRGASAAVRADACKQLRQGGLICSQAAQYCSAEDRKGPDKQCDDPLPWFDRSSACSDAQPAQYRLSANRSTATISVCGHDLYSFTDTDALFLEANAAAARDMVGKVCCDRFREATRPGTNCDPRHDIDCDGVPNTSDLRDNMLNTQTFRTPEDATVDPFPPGMDPNNPNFRPEQAARNAKGVGECPCKWELFRGKLTCSPDGRRGHTYEATWRCPMTGAEVSTRAEAPASQACR